MSFLLLWAQQQEICTSHTSESAMQEDSHSKYTTERLGGKLDCLFGEVVLIHARISHSFLTPQESCAKENLEPYVAQLFHSCDRYCRAAGEKRFCCEMHLQILGIRYSS